MYYVDVEKRREDKMLLTTTFFSDYAKAEEFYNRSKKKDRAGNQYTFSVAFCTKFGGRQERNG